MRSPFRLLLALRRRVLIHRRGLAVLCAVGAVATTLRLLTAPPPPTVAVWTARHDLASGVVLEAGDFRRTAYAPGSVPAGVVRDLDGVLGRTLVTPLGRGEPVTPAKVLGHGRLNGHPGRVAVAVRIPDATLGGLLHAGDRIDVLATNPRASPAAVASEAVVLTVPPEPAGTAADGRLAVLAVDPDEAQPLAAAGAAGFLTVIWSR